MSMMDRPRPAAVLEGAVPTMSSAPAQVSGESVTPRTAMRGSSKSKRLLITVLLLVLILLAGFGAWHQGLLQRVLNQVTADAVQAPAPAAYIGASGAFRLTANETRALRIAPISEQEFRAERIAEGRIAINEDRTTPVFAPFSGRVLRVTGRLGETVVAGAPLFEIETADLVQSANDLLGAIDALARARTTHALASRNEQRQRDLFEARAAARRDWEQAQADAANAAADLRVAETALAAARDRMRILGRSPEQVAQVEATRRVDAVVSVTAPLGGAIVQRRIGPGQWLSAGGGEPAYTIADLSTVWLIAGVRELDAPLMRVGQAVEVTVSALPERVFSAVITSVGAAIDPATRRLSVRAEVLDPEGLLKPEMFARFRIVIGPSRTRPAVANGAVIHRGEETGVWVALPDGERFAYRRVALGRRAGDLWEVAEGLAAGERVVTGGALFIDRAAPSN